MAQPGNFTPILLYGSSTPTNVPLAANLTNSATGSEIAINVADKNLFFKDSGGVVNTVPIRQSGTSSNGWLSATDWNTFNNKAPATSGTSILYGNGSGGFSNVTIGSGITFAGGTLSATGTGGTVTAVTGTAPVVSSGGTTPAISMAAATTSVNGYLTSTDWNTFNNKQPAGTYVNSVGATSPITSSGGTTPTIAIPAATTSVSGYLTSTDWNTFNNKGSGTVTSVAALTLGTTGTDLSSTVATGTTTPVITLNVPTASATNRGALSAADWTTFNNKQPAGTYVTSVTGTAPVVSSGGTTPAISMAAATTSVSGYLTSTDWNTFNSKGSGTVTSVSGAGTVNGLTLTGTVTSTGSLTLGGTLNLSSPPAIGGTTPAAGAFTTFSCNGFTSALTATTSVPSTTNSAQYFVGGAFGGTYYAGTYYSQAAAPDWFVGVLAGTNGFGIASISGGVLTQKALFSSTGLALANNLSFTSTNGVVFNGGATLNAYETGTWTPIPSGSGGSLTAYTSSGNYTKIGRQVFYTGRFTVTTPGTVNGSLTISGLPFTAGSSSTGVTREDALTGTWYFLQVTAGGSGQAQGWSITNGAILWTAGSSYAFSFTTYV